jgi:hypothetical protein
MIGVGVVDRTGLRVFGDDQKHDARHGLREISVRLWRGRPRSLMELTFRFHISYACAVGLKTVEKYCQLSFEIGRMDLRRKSDERHFQSSGFE